MVRPWPKPWLPVAVDLKSLPALQAFTSSWCHRRIQRQIHEFAVCAAGQLLAHTARPCPHHLQKLLSASEPLDGVWAAAGPMSIELIDLQPAPADLKRLVRQGLGKQPRQLPAWLLYDAEGSRLFQQICEQPEYNLTRTEIALLEDHADAIAQCVGTGVVVEFGIGNARKVEPLLKTIQPPTFVALDISQSALKQSLTDLAESYPNTTMLGICCDHSRLTALPDHPRLHGQERIGFFPGSSLGNFLPDDAVDVLQQFRRLLAGTARPWSSPRSCSAGSCLRRCCWGVSGLRPQPAQPTQP